MAKNMFIATKYVKDVDLTPNRRQLNGARPKNSILANYVDVFARIEQAITDGDIEIPAAAGSGDTIQTFTYDTETGELTITTDGVGSPFTVNLPADLQQEIDDLKDKVLQTLTVTGSGTTKTVTATLTDGTAITDTFEVGFTDVEYTSGGARIVATKTGVTYSRGSNVGTLTIPADVDFVRTVELDVDESTSDAVSGQTEYTITINFSNVGFSTLEDARKPIIQTGVYVGAEKAAYQSSNDSWTMEVTSANTLVIEFPNMFAVAGMKKCIKLLFT